MESRSRPRTRPSRGSKRRSGFASEASWVIWINVTRHPTAEWIARQITEAFPWNEAPRYLHPRSGTASCGAIVTRRLRAMGIRDKPIAPASPWQNAFAERLIGSIRRECVDHIIVLGEAHLRQRQCYARY